MERADVEDLREALLQAVALSEEANYFAREVLFGSRWSHNSSDSEDDEGANKGAKSIANGEVTEKRRRVELVKCKRCSSDFKSGSK